MIDERQKKQWLNNARQTLTCLRVLPCFLMRFNDPSWKCVALDRLRRAAELRGLSAEFEELVLAILAEQKL